MILMEFSFKNLRCKKSQRLSVDTEIIEGEKYNLEKHRDWNCPWITGKGIKGYSWIEWEDDGHHNPKSMWNFFYKPVEWRNIQLKKLEI